MNLWVWRRSVDFRLWFSLQGFCVLYFILSEFLTKDVLKCIVNPTFMIGYCDSTLINLVLKTIVLIFNTTHKMGCCEYCYWLGWYSIWRVKSESLNYPFLGQQFMVGIIQPNLLGFFREIYNHLQRMILAFQEKMALWTFFRFKQISSRYESFLLDHFLFCFNVFIFLYDCQYLFSLSSLLSWLFLLLLFLSM